MMRIKINKQPLRNRRIPRPNFTTYAHPKKRMYAFFAVRHLLKATNGTVATSGTITQKQTN